MIGFLLPFLSSSIWQLPKHHDVISFGVIVAFMLYIRYFTHPLGQIAQGVQSLQSAAAASHRNERRERMLHGGDRRSHRPFAREHPGATEPDKKKDT